jgi:hypothetical protein
MDHRNDKKLRRSGGFVGRAASRAIAAGFPLARERR